MCRTPKNQEHPTGCRCTACGILHEHYAKMDAAHMTKTMRTWLERRNTALDGKPSPAMAALESLTPGGSEYVGDPERCAEHIRGRIDSLGKLVVKLTLQRKTFREALSKAYTCRASMNSAVVEVIEKALWPERYGELHVDGGAATPATIAETKNGEPS